MLPRGQMNQVSFQLPFPWECPRGGSWWRFAVQVRALSQIIQGEKKITSSCSKRTRGGTRRLPQDGVKSAGRRAQRPGWSRGSGRRRRHVPVACPGAAIQAAAEHERARPGGLGGKFRAAGRAAYCPMAAEAAERARAGVRRDAEVSAPAAVAAALWRAGRVPGLRGGGAGRWPGGRGRR